MKKGNCPGRRNVQTPSKAHAAESRSFLKKRTKKLLRNLGEPVRTGRSQNDQKFFASRRAGAAFFFKKAGLPALTGPRAGVGGPGQLRKKKQKTFATWLRPLRIGSAQTRKVRCSFSAEKKTLPSQAGAASPMKMTVNVTESVTRPWSTAGLNRTSLKSSQLCTATSKSGSPERRIVLQTCVAPFG